jgi:hypothetical protein
MSRISKYLWSLVAIAFPLIVTGTSLISPLFLGKEHYFAVVTQDLAQLLYLFVTMAGLFNLSTKTSLYKGQTK